ncbi:MAG: DUF3293 domain-containing protein [Planctomycetaceae bacterium]|nr:DUF3293 domain-containing protein [Planctomycetaceae bacterium]
MSTFHPAYFETRFYIERPQRELLDPAIILSAFATTGEKWPMETNRLADESLRGILEDLPHRELIRLIGYSPRDGHCEPSWHIDCDLSTGCRIGREFYQDALYVIEQGELYVVLCKAPEHRARVGRLSERLDWLEPESMSQSLDRY